jgi:hypothetical protein
MSRTNTENRCGEMSEEDDWRRVELFRACFDEFFPSCGGESLMGVRSPQLQRRYILVSVQQFTIL